MEGVSNTTMILLLNEIIKYELKSTDSDFPTSLSEISAVEFQDKKKSLRRLGRQVGKSSMNSMVREHIWMRRDKEIMRFLCKEYWHYLFGKYVDRLQTNNKGIYVIYDNGFSWLPSWSLDDGNEAVKRISEIMLAFIEGTIEGGIGILGIGLKAEGVIEDSSCKFTINIDMSSQEK